MTNFEQHFVYTFDEYCDNLTHFFKVAKIQNELDRLTETVETITLKGDIETFYINDRINA